MTLSEKPFRRDTTRPLLSVLLVKVCVFSGQCNCRQKMLSRRVRLLTAISELSYIYAHARFCERVRGQRDNHQDVGDSGLE